MAATKTKKHPTLAELTRAADWERALQKMFQEGREFIASKKDAVELIIKKLADPANHDAAMAAFSGGTGYSWNDASRNLGSLTVAEDVFEAQYEMATRALEAVATIWESNDLVRYGILAMLAENRLCDGTWSRRDYNELTASLRTFLTIVDGSEAGTPERAAYCALVGGEDGQEVIDDLLSEDVSIEDAVKTAFGALRV